MNACLLGVVRAAQIGLGTGGIYLEDAHAVFTTALAQGYRLFDLAREYRNEHLLAEALATSGVPRSEVFLQTKVWPTQLGFQPTLRAISTSLQQLRTGYIDHYMLHWPRYVYNTNLRRVYGVHLCMRAPLDIIRGALC